jgi:ATP-dependent exoDNAse (exonuclease V) beta subunit
MLQRLGFHGDLSPSELDAEAMRLVRPDERAGTADDSQMIQDAVRAYRTIAHRADVRSLYLSGERWHEVPFTARLDGAFLRGTIDCLVRTADTVTILEFKTGVQQPQHAAQLDLYRRAVEQLFPDMKVGTALIYANDR